MTQACPEPVSLPCNSNRFRCRLFIIIWQLAGRRPRPAIRFIPKKVDRSLVSSYLGYQVGLCYGTFYALAMKVYDFKLI